MNESHAERIRRLESELEQARKEEADAAAFNDAARALVRGPTSTADAVRLARARIATFRVDFPDQKEPQVPSRLPDQPKSAVGLVPSRRELERDR